MLQFFTVRDSAADAYLDPFALRSNGEAVRSFKDAVNAEGHQFAAHAGDYTLFHIGCFDPSTGEIVASVPVSLGNGLDFVDAPRLQVDGAS